MTFENKVYEGIYYSQFVASWIKVGGKMDHTFKYWLQGLKINGHVIPDDIIFEIFEFGRNGKLELEQNAQFYLNNHEFDPRDRYGLNKRA